MPNHWNDCTAGLTQFSFTFQSEQITYLYYYHSQAVQSLFWNGNTDNPITVLQDLPFACCDGVVCHIWVVQRGFSSDGCSCSPDLAWVKPFPPVLSCLLHDWLYTTHGLTDGVVDLTQAAADAVLPPVYREAVSVLSMVIRYMGWNQYWNTSFNDTQRLANTRVKI